MADPALLVGVETGDDAAIYQLGTDLAVVATTDFFTPIVDDAVDFGRIAAANALSDIYAMGARPLFALAVTGMPVDRVPLEVIQRILTGGAEVCAAAGITVAGGHSIDTLEPIYGLAAIGVIDPQLIKRNVGARPGDVLILGKPLGIGLLATAVKAGTLSPAGYAELVATTTQLNSIGMELAHRNDVHAMTDVSGFGLIGHLLEICHASRVMAALDVAALPVLATARELHLAGVRAGAAERNRAAFRADVTTSEDLPGDVEALLYDPQTSGGLLLACRATAAPEVLALFHRAGYLAAAVIGTVEAGASGIRI